MKIHIQILAWLYIGICTPLLAAGLIVCIGLAWHGDAEGIKALQYVGPPVGFAAVVYLIPGLTCGIGLLHLRPWARILGLVMSVLQIPLLPAGTVLAMYGFRILTRQEAKDSFHKSVRLSVTPSSTRMFRSTSNSIRGYPAGGTPYFTGRPSLSSLHAVLAPMAIVGGGFFLVLKIGFLLHHEPAPSPIDSFGFTVTAALIFLAGIAALIAGIVRSRGNPMANAQAQAEASARWRAEDDIARNNNANYDNDLTLTATCVHLRSIEAAMRAAGIPACRYREHDASVKCRIDLDALKREFAVAAPIRYPEFFAGNPEDHEHPTAFLICDAHKSMIHTLHPEESGAMRAPVFPASE